MVKIKKLRRPTPPPPKAEPIAETQAASMPTGPRQGGWIRLPGGQWGYVHGDLGDWP